MAGTSRFRVHWVLRDELLLGPAPRAEHHLQILQDSGVTAVLSLCAEEEAPPPPGLAERFVCARLVLPDHRAAEAMRLEQLKAALAHLREIRCHGPVYVHCLASMERSPLLCLAWLMQQRGLSRLQALDYLMQVHPGTNPLASQLALLDQLD